MGWILPFSYKQGQYTIFASSPLKSALPFFMGEADMGTHVELLNTQRKSSLLLICLLSTGIET